MKRFRKSEKKYFERLLNENNESNLNMEELRPTQENVFFHRIRTIGFSIPLKKI